jgi:hypothetical protein
MQGCLLALTLLKPFGCKGVKIVTFDNADVIQKCVAVTKQIELILRISYY